MDTLRPTTGSLVWHLAMRWRAEADRAIAPLGLTHAQYSALASLHAMTGRGLSPTQRELADYTRLQPLFVSKLVRALEADGHVLRTADRRDSRAIRLELTEAGRATTLEAQAIVRALDGRLTGPIGGPDGERTRLLGDILGELIDRHDRQGDGE